MTWFFNYIYTESVNFLQLTIDFYSEHLIIFLNKICTKTYTPEEAVENIFANSLNTVPEVPEVPVDPVDPEVPIKKESDLDQEKLDNLLEEVLKDLTPSKTSIKTSNDLFYIYKMQLQLFYRLGFLDLNLKEKISTIYPTLAEDLKMLYYADLNSPKIDLEISCNRIEELGKIQGSLMEAFFKSSYNLIDLIKASKVQKDFIEIVKKEDNFASILNKFSIECASIPKDGPNSSFYAKTEMARLKSINIRAGERREKDFFKICQELNQTYFQKRYSRDLIGEEKIVYFPEEENLLLRE